jgi:biotin carboxyl carrier protein
MNRYTVTVNGRTHDVELIEQRGSFVRFETGGTTYEVDISPQLVLRERSGAPVGGVAPRPAAKPKQAKAAGDVVAPMPGIIVSVGVSVGQTVTTGQSLLVMEAMKMENNITATGAGVVKEILVKPGQQVENGQLLIKLGAA